MIHDEKTTELELPSHLKKVDPTPAPDHSQALSVPVAISADQKTPWYKDLDLGAPWVLRLIAVIAIIVLSMLML